MRGFLGSGLAGIGGSCSGVTRGSTSVWPGAALAADGQGELARPRSCFICSSILSGLCRVVPRIGMVFYYGGVEDDITPDC